MLLNVTSYYVDPGWTADQVVKEMWVWMAEKGFPVDVFKCNHELTFTEYAFVVYKPRIGYGAQTHYYNSLRGNDAWEGALSKHLMDHIQRSKLREVAEEKWAGFSAFDPKITYNNLYHAIDCLLHTTSFPEKLDNTELSYEPVTVYVLPRYEFSFTYKAKKYTLTVDETFESGDLLIKGDTILEEGCLSYERKLISDEWMAGGEMIAAGYTPDRSPLAMFLKIKEKDPKKIADAKDKLDTLEANRIVELEADYHDQILNALNNKLKSLGYDPVDELKFGC